MKNDSNATENQKVVNVNKDAKNGQDKCPKCGSTDISINVNNGLLRCNFCRYEFKPEKVDGLVSDISSLEGEVLTTGAQDIVADSKDILTFKCSSCGSEVVIDTASSSQARCHWCRNYLSVNETVPNGSVPDVVLPFSVKKEEAKQAIETFVGKRKFFAHPKFKQEFTLDNVMGVYFPYMIVDINGHANLIGNAEKTTRTYTKRVNDRTVTYYDADVYQVQRDFDITIEGLTVESSADKLNKNNAEKTTNVINAIMPFDIENAVKWNANYLRCFTSEKRDVNIENIKPLVNTQAKDIAKFSMNDTIKEYDRGAAWRTNDLTIKGEQWKTAYLPVWLYSYQQTNGNNKMLHYVAVNARTKETMGSVPIYMPMLIGISLVIEFFGLLLTLFADFDYDWIFLLSGVIYFFVIYSKYRNQGARHKHETETKRTVANLTKNDQFVTHQKGLRNSKIVGVNNDTVGNTDITTLINNFTNNNEVANLINNIIDKDK